MSDTLSEKLVQDTLLKFVPVEAEIQSPMGERLVAFDENFWRSIPRESLPRLGEIMSIDLFKRVQSQAHTTYPEIATVQELDMNTLLKLCTVDLASRGFGNFALKRRDNFLFIDLYHSLFAEILPKQQDCACSFYSGLFKGLFSQISTLSLLSVEITCGSQGYEYCSFLLDQADLIDSVQNKISTKVTALQAFEKVKKEMEL